MSWFAPPWILFIDKGKPLEILPAMRSGAVADVRHLTRAQADQLVRAGNDFGALLRDMRVTIGADRPAFDHARHFMAIRALLNRARATKDGTITRDMPMHDDVILSLESALRAAGEAVPRRGGAT